MPFAALITLALAVPTAVAVEAPARALALAECLKLAVAHNPELQSQLLEARIGQLDYARAAHRFGLAFRVGPELKRSIRPTSQSFITGVNRLEEWTQDYRLALEQQLISGGKVAVRFNQNVFDTNSNRVDFNPSFAPGLALEFDQPLLRDGWQGGREVEIAHVEALVAGLKARERLIKLVADTEIAYWELVAAREAIRVREQALGLVRDLLTINREKAKAGLLAQLDVLQAEASLAVREGSLLGAQRELATSEDALRRLIDPRFRDPAWQIALLPTDRPTFRERPVTFDAAWGLASARRPDLATSELENTRQQSLRDQAGNKLWPKLDLEGSAGLNNVNANAAQAVNELGQLRTYDLRAGVVLEVPLGGNVARDDYEKSELRLEQARLDRLTTQQTAYIEVRETVRNVSINARRVAATGLAKRLADAKLDAEQAKLKAGLSTNFQVLQFQEDFEQASLDEVRATIEYLQALTRLERAQGTLLESRGIATPGGPVNVP